MHFTAELCQCCGGKKGAHIAGLKSQKPLFILLKLLIKVGFFAEGAFHQPFFLCSLCGQIQWRLGICPAKAAYVCAEVKDVIIKLS